MNNDNLTKHLTYLKLPYIRENHEAIGQLAARKQWDYVHYLAELIKEESNLRHDRTIQRRIRMARFPVVKTLDQFNWSWPKKINRAQIQNLFRLKFIEDKSNVVCADARWVFPNPTPPIKTTLLLSSMNFNRNRF